MKKNLSLILICFALTIGLVGGFMIEGRTHFWEGLNTSRDLLLEHRKPIGNYGQIGGREICLIKEWHHIKIIVFIGGHEMLSEFAFDDLLKE
jgi:hypothetical protein